MTRKAHFLLAGLCCIAFISIAFILALGGLYAITSGPRGVPFRMNRLTGKTWRMDFTRGTWADVGEKPSASNMERPMECKDLLAKVLTRKSFSPGTAILAATYDCGDMLTLHAVVKNPEYLKLPPKDQEEIREAFLQQVIMPEPEFQLRTPQEKEEVIRRVRTGELAAGGQVGGDAL